MTDLLVRAVSVAETRPLRLAVLRPHETIESLARDEPAGAFAVGAFQRGALVAVGLVVPDGEPGAWRIRGMATAADMRGRGIGAAVLAYCEAHARAHGGRRLWCNARVAARGFYEQAGFAVEGDVFELPMIGPHYLMSKTLQDVRQPPREAARAPS